MKYIIGLGNPEKKHNNNRHNAGKMFCEFLKSLKILKNVKVLISDSYMNDSGNFVLKKIKGKNLRDVYLAFDDLDLKIGEFKIQFAKGPKVHNGLNDVYKKVNTNEFWHIRIGVDNREIENKEPGMEYVLSDFNGEEVEILNNTFKEICKKLVK